VSQNQADGRTLPLAVEYNPLRDVLMVDGVKYAGTLFRMISSGRLWRAMRIIERTEDGQVVMQDVQTIADGVVDAAENLLKEASALQSDGAAPPLLAAAMANLRAAAARLGGAGGT